MQIWSFDSNRGQKCSFDHSKVEFQLPFNSDAALNVVREFSPSGSLMQDSSAQQFSGDYLHSNLLLTTLFIGFDITIHCLCYYCNYNMLYHNDVPFPADSVPKELLPEFKSMFCGLTELLRHFWSCFPITCKELEEKAGLFIGSRFKDAVDLLNNSLHHLLLYQNT